MSAFRTTRATSSFFIAVLPSVVDCERICKVDNYVKDKNIVLKGKEQQRTLSDNFGKRTSQRNIAKKGG